MVKKRQENPNIKDPIKIFNTEFPETRKGEAFKYPSSLLSALDIIGEFLGSIDVCKTIKTKFSSLIDNEQIVAPLLAYQLYYNSVYRPLQVFACNFQSNSFIALALLLITYYQFNQIRRSNTKLLLYALGITSTINTFASADNKLHNTLFKKTFFMSSIRMKVIATNPNNSSDQTITIHYIDYKCYKDTSTESESNIRAKLCFSQFIQNNMLKLSLLVAMEGWLFEVNNYTQLNTNKFINLYNDIISRSNSIPRNS